MRHIDRTSHDRYTLQSFVTYTSDCAKGGAHWRRRKSNSCGSASFRRIWALRKVAGWTTQQLANELGVARQTISNLETGRSPMTKLQYLALRTVFSAEIAECGNRELAKIIKTLVDDPIELRIKELGTAGSSDDAKEPTDETADNTKANSATEPDAPSEADDARPVAPASKPAAGRRARKNKERPLSTAMQALAVITAALASGTAAGVLTYLLFPNGKPGKNGRR